MCVAVWGGLSVFRERKEGNLSDDEVQSTGAGWHHLINLLKTDDCICLAEVFMNEKERALLNFSQRMKTILDKAQQRNPTDFAGIKQDLAWLKQDYNLELGGLEMCDPDVTKFGAVLRDSESLILQADPTTYL